MSQLSVANFFAVQSCCFGPAVTINRTRLALRIVSGVAVLIFGKFTAGRAWLAAAVDHLGIVTFDGLVEVVDALGTVTLCTPHVRESNRDLLPEGCSVADGATALPWLRSRQTQELVDGEWRFVEGVGDLARIERQQDLLLALLAKPKTMRSPTTLAAVVTDLGDALQLDESFSLGDAIGAAWRLRAVPIAEFRRLTVSVEAFATADGHLAARPTKPFLELIAGT